MREVASPGTKLASLSPAPSARYQERHAAKDGHEAFVNWFRRLIAWLRGERARPALRPLDLELPAAVPAAQRQVEAALPPPTPPMPRRAAAPRAPASEAARRKPLVLKAPDQEAASPPARRRPRAAPIETPPILRLREGEAERRDQPRQAPIRAVRQPMPATAEPAAFPRFRTTAGDQMDPRLADRLAGVRMKLRNAFTPAQPVTDRRRFAGRGEVLAALIGAIEDQRLHVIIYGERGIGKTSLLHVLTQAAREARYLVIYIPGGADSNFDEMFRAIAGGIPLLFHAGFGPTSEKAEQGATLADLAPPEPVTVRLASDLLAKVTGTRVLVVLDEFDRCKSGVFRRNIAELLKTLSDRSSRVQLVIAGVAANLTELVDFVPSIQRNIFALQAPKMTAGELRKLVRTGEEATGLTFEEPAVTLIVQVANGLPYFGSLLSHHAGLIALGEGRMAVTAGDVDGAILEVLRELEGRISRRSRAQVARCVPDASPSSVAAVAVAAQSSGGIFTLDDIAASEGGPEHLARCEHLIECLVAEGLAMSAPREGDGRPAWRFAEDSVAPYLWLLAARARAGAGDETTPARRAETPRTPIGAQA